MGKLKVCRTLISSGRTRDLFSECKKLHFLNLKDLNKDQGNITEKSEWLLGTSKNSQGWDRNTKDWNESWMRMNLESQIY